MLTSALVRRFRETLLAWYRANARKGLPWRRTRDPYAVWVSETMLQQTQVRAVLPYYGKFLDRFPTVEALAAAPTTQVLEAWSGLGYYSRARNLQEAARRIVREHGGRLPDDPADLQRLPGIGRYTAGAVASIAYDRAAPILDGNVLRLLTRYFSIREDPKGPAVQRRLWALAERLVPDESPGQFNQAMMELGALVCAPRNPRCDRCPLSRGCRARIAGLQSEIPLRSPPAARKKILYACGILQRDGAYLLARRPLTGLLPGLWEFPGGEIQRGESAPEGLARSLKERLRIEARPQQLRAQVEQTLSHRELQIRAFDCRWSGRCRPCWYLETRSVPRSELSKVPFTAGMRDLAKRLLCCSLFALLLAGCATTAGPRISRQELRVSRAYYEVQAQRHLYRQLLRLRTVGSRLLEAVPAPLRPKSPQPSVGMLVDNLTLISGRVFAVAGIEPRPQRGRGCLIAGVIPGGAADQAGLQPGDLILKVGPWKTRTVYDAADAFDRLKPGVPVTLRLEREGIQFDREFRPAAKRYPVSFDLADDPQVNAYATPGRILVTTGLLRFIASDDELAVVIGHELAHLTQGHIVKGGGVGILVNLLGAITGVAADILIPAGVSDVLRQIAGAGSFAPFSRNFELEADLVGLQYAHRAGYRIEAGAEFWDRFATELPRSHSESFFSTHPSSPERLLRLRKAAADLRAAEGI